jgi:REP-associated tyrosine transposase
MAAISRIKKTSASRRVAADASWPSSRRRPRRIYLTQGRNACTLSAMLGLHLVFSTYGFWPPNDPRGSGSTRVKAQHIYEAGGQATKVHAIHSLAAEPHDPRVRRAISSALKFPPVKLNGVQAQAVGQGFAVICRKVDLTIHACAILPDHVHVVVARHRLDGDEIIACLKRAGTRAMNEAGLHPLAAFSRATGKHPCSWGGGGWKVFLETPGEMRQRIQYVEENPGKAGFRRQHWSCVVPYRG